MPVFRKGQPRPWKEGRKKRVGIYPPVLTRETLDQDHKDVIAFVGKFHKEQRHAPTMREVGRGLGRSSMWTRDAVHRLGKSGFLMGVPGPGTGRTLRCADPSEMAAGAVARWEAWLSELPPREVELLRIALGGAGQDFSGLHEDPDSSPTLCAPAGTPPRVPTVEAE